MAAAAPMTRRFDECLLLPLRAAAVQVLRMPLEEFELQMVSGDMMLPSITTAYMAIRELQKRGRL